MQRAVAAGRAGGGDPGMNGKKRRLGSRFGRKKWGGSTEGREEDERGEENGEREQMGKRKRVSRGEGTRAPQCGRRCPCSASAASVLGPEGTPGLWVMPRSPTPAHWPGWDAATALEPFPEPCACLVPGSPGTEPALLREAHLRARIHALGQEATKRLRAVVWLRPLQSSVPGPLTPDPSH